jgi:ParB family chromosome partitioning protein
MSSKKLADRVGMVPISVPSPAPSGFDLSAESRAKTAPGQMMAFMAKESAALKENEALRAENEALKSAEISIESIIEVKGRRRVLSSEKFAELVENLRQNALAVPVTVRSVGGGKFELISGHNRMHAFVALGRKSIPAAVLNFDDVEASKAAFFANLISDTLPDYEKFKGFKLLMAQTGQTQVEVAREAGIAASIVSKIMAFDKLPQEAIEMISVQPDRVSLSAVDKLKKLPGMLDGMKALIEGKSLPEAVTIAAQVKEKTAVVRPKPIVVKSGHERVAEISRREGVVSVKFKDEALAIELALEIEKLIRSKAAS